MKYILTDIEGTTTSISFVHEVLFPFSKEKLKSFVLNHLDRPEVKANLDLTKETALEEYNRVITDNDACDMLISWINTDRKHPALKNLQGLIWEEGYVSGIIQGHVYKDVPKALENWKNTGITLGVYSSGSVKAQHLIFEYSTEGNLRPFFSHHFDTAIGHKREKQSYLNIAQTLNLPPEEILFLSDIKEELDAAHTAGMKTIQLVRQEDVHIGEHQTAKDFSEIKI
jgi:enolase-phosphatase E1